MNTSGSLNLTRGSNKMPKGKGYSLKNPPAKSVMGKGKANSGSAGKGKKMKKMGRSKKY